MTAQEYILSEVAKLKEPLPEVRVEGSVEDAIFAKLLSKKFRKLKADDELISIAKKAISLALQNNKPVTLSLLFGGNKLWRFDEAPYIDWAELFNLLYYLEFAKSIATVYEHGVHLDYYSQDISAESLNNIPKSETDKYSESFKELLQWLKPYLPAGVTVGYRRHADEYDDPSEYLAELEEAKKVFLEENNGKLPELSKAQKAATELNVKLKPGQNNDPLWREKVELTHRAIFYTKSLQPYLHDESLIPLAPTPFPGCLATGSTKSSIAKFWAGVGALRPKQNGYDEIVLSPKQLAQAKFQWEDTKLRSLDGKNFERIRVLK